MPEVMRISREFLPTSRIIPWAFDHALFPGSVEFELNLFFGKVVAEYTHGLFPGLCRSVRPRFYPVEQMAHSKGLQKSV